jgi:uncharacterized membrane protein YhaH (DUF805 family)
MRTISAVKDVSFKDAYIRYWLRWADYRGRSSRQEYWKLVIVSAVVSIVVSTIAAAVSASWIMLLFEIVNFVPGVTLVVRRLHDAGLTDRQMLPLLACEILLFVVSAIAITTALVWLVFVASLALLIVGITVFILLLRRSAPDNAYGLEPR